MRAAGLPAAHDFRMGRWVAEPDAIRDKIAAAEADIERVQKAVDKCIIKAPMSGKVTVLNAEVGELVVVGTMNNAGTVILTIGGAWKYALGWQLDFGVSDDIVVEGSPDVVFVLGLSKRARR